MARSVCWSEGGGTWLKTRPCHDPVLVQVGNIALETDACAISLSSASIFTSNSHSNSRYHCRSPSLQHPHKSPACHVRETTITISRQYGIPLNIGPSHPHLALASSTNCNDLALPPPPVTKTTTIWASPCREFTSPPLPLHLRQPQRSAQTSNTSLSNSSSGAKTM